MQQTTCDMSSRFTVSVCHLNVLGSSRNGPAPTDQRTWCDTGKETKNNISSFFESCGIPALTKLKETEPNEAQIWQVFPHVWQNLPQTCRDRGSRSGACLVPDLVSISFKKADILFQWFFKVISLWVYTLTEVSVDAKRTDVDRPLVSARQLFACHKRTLQSVYPKWNCHVDRLQIMFVAWPAHHWSNIYAFWCVGHLHKFLFVRGWPKKPCVEHTNRSEHR